MNTEGELSGGRRGETGSVRWTVVGVSTAVNALAWGARSTFALFYVAMLEEFAWGRGPTALSLETQLDSGGLASLSPS